MARISSYPLDQDIVGNDKVIGTNYTGQITKNYSLQGIANWLNSKGSVAIAGQNNFFFQDASGNTGRLVGSMSFPNFGGDGTQFTNILSMRFSEESAADTYIMDYMATLVGKNVILAQTDNLNNFGVYQFSTITQNVAEPLFWDITFTPIEGNGALLADSIYALAAYPGGGTGDANYVFNQLSPAAVWTVAHNLGKWPAVTIVDDNDELIYADVEFVDNDSLTITFSTAVAGRAFIN